VPLPLQGKEIKLDSIFLRDACSCPLCIDSSTSQKNFQTSDIPASIKGRFIGTEAVNGSEVALIEWQDDIPAYVSDRHVSQLPLPLLEGTLQGDKRLHISHFDPTNRVYWNNTRMTQDNTFISHGSYIKDDVYLHRVLKRLESHGLAFLKDVPDTIATDSSNSLNSIVGRVGVNKSSFYGLTWDVRSVPNAINVAYTHVFLGLHMDLCYLDLTPQFQLLHSMRARAPGGESIFSDSFAAAEQVRREDPELFEALVRFPVTFKYYNANESYRQIRRTVELDDPSDLNSAIRNVNWSPPFQGPLALDVGLLDGGKALRKWHAAAQRFEKLISAPENLFELRMNEGDCVLFDNRRVLHARRAFDVTKGERWLKGAYIDRDVFASRLARLEETYGTGNGHR
jgi:gamma-butyrobetaine dioxygenase